MAEATQTRVPLQALLAEALLAKQRAQAARGSALATAIVEAFAADRMVKDPLGRAHELLNRRDRRALGWRGYQHGQGALSPSVRTRHAR